MYLNGIRVRSVVSVGDDGFHDLLAFVGQSAIPHGLVLEVTLIGVPDMCVGEPQIYDFVVRLQQEGCRTVLNRVFASHCGATKLSVDCATRNSDVATQASHESRTTERSFGLELLTAEPYPSIQVFWLNLFPLLASLWRIKLLVKTYKVGALGAARQPRDFECSAHSSRWIRTWDKD